MSSLQPIDQIRWQSLDPRQVWISLPDETMKQHLKQAYFNIFRHRIPAKAATEENESTFTSSFSKKSAPEGRVRLILRRNWRLTD